MGCCLSQSSKPELEIISIENSLEIKLQPAIRIDRLIHRYSNRLQISPLQFAALCKELQVEKHSFSYKYFKMFYNESNESHNARELASAGIMHCQGTDEEKINLLFQNYDIDSSKTLEAEEIKLMVADLTNIALLYSSEFTLATEVSRNLNSGGSLRLIEYRKELVCIRPILMSFYNVAILEDHPKKITLEEFHEIFLKNDMISLIIPHEMRKLSQRFSLMLSKTVNMVQYMMKNPKSIDKSFTRRLGTGIPGKKSKARRINLSN